MSVQLPTREGLLRAALRKKIQKEAGARGGRNTRDVIPRVDRNRPLPLSFAQQRLWFIAQLDSAASGAYHIPAALRLTGKLDRAALHAALDRLMGRQEGLRTRFVLLDGVPHQVIAPDSVGFALIEANLTHLAEDLREQAVKAECAEEARAPFDLAAGPMIRGRLLRLAEDEHVLLVAELANVFNDPQVIPALAAATDVDSIRSLLGVTAPPVTAPPVTASPEEH